MATPLSDYEQFRRAIRDLSILARRDLEVLWRSVGGTEEARDALFDVLPDLIDTYGLAAATVAADFYDQIRDTVGAAGRFTAIVPDLGKAGASELVGWAVSTAADRQSLQTLVEGGMQRRISNAARTTVTYSSSRDPGCRGWMRIGTGSCDFCAMLVSRGTVYRSESTATFAAHDWCNCQAAPAFNPSQIVDVRKQFVPSARRRSEETKEADRDRVKDWIAANL